MPEIGNLNDENWLYRASVGSLVSNREAGRLSLVLRARRGDVRPGVSAGAADTRRTARVEHRLIRRTLRQPVC